MHTEKKKIQQLLFVYNANSGARNAILDSMHKVFSPSTYDCNLCHLTYGLLTENRVWKKFREQSKIPMQFLHKDEFVGDYASKFGLELTFPIILFKNGNVWDILVSTGELGQLKTPQELIGLIRGRLG